MFAYHSLNNCPRSRFSRIGLAVIGLAGCLYAATGCHRHSAPAAGGGALPVEAITVIQQDVPLIGEFIGTTKGFIDAQIHPKVQGYLLEQNYTNGTLVRKDQLLFKIDARQFQANLDQAIAQLKKAQAELEKSNIDVARYTPLSQQGAISQQELDTAVQQRLANQAQVEAAQAAVDQAQLNLGWTQVTAPITGIAGINVTQIGDLVSESSQLTTVSQVDPIKVQFPISEQQYLRVIAQGERRNELQDERTPIELTLILADGSVYPEKGVMTSLDRQVDVSTGTIMAEGQFPNPKYWLRPGQFAKVQLHGGVAKGALLVPQRAVIEIQGNYQVAVVTPDSKAELRTVVPGQRVGDLWLIEQGLKPGERVITEGIMKLKEGMPVQVTPGAARAPVATNQPPAAN